MPRTRSRRTGPPAIIVGAMVLALLAGCSGTPADEAEAEATDELADDDTERSGDAGQTTEEPDDAAEPTDEAVDGPDDADAQDGELEETAALSAAGVGPISLALDGVDYDLDVLQCLWDVEAPNAPGEFVDVIVTAIPAGTPQDLRDEAYGIVGADDDRDILDLNARLGEHGAQFELMRWRDSGDLAIFYPPGGADAGVWTSSWDDLEDGVRFTEVSGETIRGSVGLADLETGAAAGTLEFEATCP